MVRQMIDMTISYLGLKIFVGAKQVGEPCASWVYLFSDRLRPGHNHHARPLRDWRNTLQGEADGPRSIRTEITGMPSASPLPKSCTEGVNALPDHYKIRANP